VPQYGVGGYRVDFAATHPHDPSRMVLAIEADGASYWQSGSVRDRDRLRGEHLQRLGWRYHRLWSTNWFRHPDGEVAKLREAYLRAVAEAAGDHAASADPVGQTAPAAHPDRPRPAGQVDRPTPGGRSPGRPDTGQSSASSPISALAPLTPATVPGGQTEARAVTEAPAALPQTSVGTGSALGSTAVGGRGAPIALGPGSGQPERALAAGRNEPTQALAAADSEPRRVLAARDSPQPRELAAGDSPLPGVLAAGDSTRGRVLAGRIEPTLALEAGGPKSTGEA
jgi:hypothetical protein